MPARIWGEYCSYGIHRDDHPGAPNCNCDEYDVTISPFTYRTTVNAQFRDDPDLVPASLDRILREVSIPEEEPSVVLGELRRLLGDVAPSTSSVLDEVRRLYEMGVLTMDDLNPLLRERADEVADWPLEEEPSSRVDWYSSQPIIAPTPAFISIPSEPSAPVKPQKDRWELLLERIR